MRINVLMISVLLLALLAIGAQAADWVDDSGSQSADQLISGGDQGMGSLTQQAQAARAAELGQTGTDTLSESSGSKLSSGASTPQQARSEELNQTVTTKPSATNVTSPVQPETPTQLAVISGSWSLELNDSASHKAALTIFQDGDAAYGTGNINLDANTTMTAAASGTVTGDKANLDIVSLGKVSLYRISMTISGDSATGSYTTFSPGVASATGTVSGVRAVPSS